jgi:ParB-like chromosome segregation protein Spo0J
LLNAAADFIENDEGNRPVTADLLLERRPLEQLLPYAANARTHSDEQVVQIAAGIAEFGFANPVLIDERGVLIAGHGR